MAQTVFGYLIYLIYIFMIFMILFLHLLHSFSFNWELYHMLKTVDCLV